MPPCRDIWSQWQLHGHSPPKMWIISSRICVSDVNFPENGRSTTADYLGRVTAPRLKEKHSPGFLQSVNNVLSDSLRLFSSVQQKK